MPATLAGTFRAMAFNNAMANRRLLAACLTLEDAAFLAPRTGFFPSLAETLNHILYVDWFYVDALEGGRLGPEAWADPLPCPKAADLMREQAAVDRRLIAVVEAFGPDGLDGPVEIHRGDRIQTARRARLLLHLFQHQVHHRGQAHAMLSGTPAAPPQLDEFFVADDASRRTEDLAAMGWSEALIFEGGTGG